MSKLTVEVDHSLGWEEATRRLKDEIQRATASGELPVSDVSQQWQDNILTFGFHAMGLKIAGTLTVEDTRVVVETKLPLVAIAFKGMIRDQIRHELGELLA
jgi:hypothetical protein